VGLVALNGFDLHSQNNENRKCFSSMTAVEATQDTTYEYTSLQRPICFQKKQYQHTKIGMIQIYTILFLPFMMLLPVLNKF
jgi:hypothetical protein